MRGSGEEDKRQEVRNEWHFGSRSIGIRSIAFADLNAAWPKPLFALLAQSPIMIGSLSLLAASSPESLWKGWRYGECKRWKRLDSQMGIFFLLYAAWVRSRAERPSVSYTKVVMEVAWTGHN